MEFYVIQDGQPIPLHDGNPFWVIGTDGTGMAPTERMREQGPRQHGETDRGYRLKARTFSVVFKTLCEDEEDVVNQRQYLLDLFAPSDNPLQLRWVLDNGAIRQIDCDYAGDLQLSTADREGYAFKCAVSFNAADPTFYDPTMESVPFRQVGGGTGEAIPMHIPTTFGTSVLSQLMTIDNGERAAWTAYPAITIVGPIVNCKIENLTTGLKLDFTGYSLGSGVVYEINTSYGEKTVLTAAGVNKIHELTTDSDLTDFVLVKGGNAIRISGTGVTDVTRLVFKYFKRYTGI